jgi:hypothetical protein
METRGILERVRLEGSATGGAAGVEDVGAEQVAEASPVRAEDQAGTVSARRRGGTTSTGITFNLVRARWKNRRAVAASRRVETSTSMTCPCWLTAR